MLRAVIIDFDDTLCLTAEACFKMENEVLATMGRPPIPRDVYMRTWGSPLLEAIVIRSPGISAEAYEAAYRPVIEKYTRRRLLDTIPDVNYQALDTLAEMDKSLMILTSRSHAELAHLLEPDHLLASRVQAFYYRDNMQFHKPDPRAFDELLSHHDLQPTQCVYVGDSVSDAMAAKQAGLHFIASLESGLRQKADFDDQAVDRFIYRFPELVDAVRSLEA